VASVFCHIHSYLNNLRFLITNALVKGWLPNSTIAPLSLIILSYCSQSGSNAITISHLHLVVPYGKSHNIISILLSSMYFIPSKQSMLYILFISSKSLTSYGSFSDHNQPLYNSIQSFSVIVTNQPSLFFLQKTAGSSSASASLHACFIAS